MHVKVNWKHPDISCLNTSILFSKKQKHFLMSNVALSQVTN
jgi:hypothetical protein